MKQRSYRLLTCVHTIKNIILQDSIAYKTAQVNKSNSTGK